MNTEKNNISEEKTEVPTNESVTEEIDKETQDQAKYLRLYAEFKNFQRRTAKEKIELMDNASERIVKRVLPVLDDLTRALKDPNHDLLALQQGIQLIYDKLERILQQEYVEAIPVQSGDSFDSNLHEAITKIPVEDEKLQDKIVDVVETGYRLNDKVIRFAKVVIGTISS